MNEWLADKWESTRVWWFMRDAQTKQAIVVTAVAVFVNLLPLLTNRNEGNRLGR